MVGVAAVPKTPPGLAPKTPPELPKAPVDVEPNALVVLSVLAGVPKAPGPPAPNAFVPPPPKAPNPLVAGLAAPNTPVCAWLLLFAPPNAPASQIRTWF